MPLGFLMMLLIAFLLGIAVGWLMLARRRPPALDAPPPPAPPPPVPVRFDATAFASALAPRLAGAPANGAALTDGTGASPTSVVWVDGGDELLVHLDSVTTRVQDGIIIASIDVETDQTGRTPLVARFAVGGPNDPAGLVAVTDALPAGNGLLAARWGQTVQTALWSGILSLVIDHAVEHHLTPHGLSAHAGYITLHTSATP